MLTHYLNQCWHFVNWTRGNKLQWNFYRNSNIFIKEMHLKTLSRIWRPFCLGLNVLTFKGWYCKVSFPIMNNDLHKRILNYQCAKKLWRRYNQRDKRERSWGWQLWYSLETLKLVFNVSGEYHGCHPDNLSISVTNVAESTHASSYVDHCQVALYNNTITMCHLGKSSFSIIWCV